jgi:FAD/FMN-containing dehydrogenase
VDPGRYAIGAEPPSAAVRISTREELSQALRAATQQSLTVVPWGGGTEVGRCDPPRSYGLALDLTGLDRIVEYDPEDLTITAECGVTIGKLRAAVAARGQELPLESALADRATLGGVLARNASGPRRMRFGAPRDRVLGATFALGDGTLARSGGKVVKNVAGYALHRLLCGSRGSLGIFVEASLKLLPAPAARVALLYPVKLEVLGDETFRKVVSELDPAFLSVAGREVASRLLMPGLSEATLPTHDALVFIGLEDDAPWVAEQERRMLEHFGRPAARLEGDSLLALAQALADLEYSIFPSLTFTTADRSTGAIAPLSGEIVRRCVFHARSGRLSVPSPEAPGGAVRALGDRGFSLVDARGVTASPFVPAQGSVLELRERLRAELDPGSRFAFGDRWGQPAGE